MFEKVKVEFKNKFNIDPNELIPEKYNKVIEEINKEGKISRYMPGISSRKQQYWRDRFDCHNNNGKIIIKEKNNVSDRV